MGHGCGDSLLLLLSHRDLPQLEKISGITSLTAHHVRSQARVNELLDSDPTLITRTSVELFAGDAVWRRGEIHHPLAENAQQHFDVILALDCAYHFNTRGEFLQQSFSHLARGGHIALADICFDSTPSAVVRLFLSTVLRTIPRENIQSKQQYIAEMGSIGYADVNMEDITEDVFPGFVRFLSTQSIAFRLLGKSIAILHAMGARFVIITGVRAL